MKALIALFLVPALAHAGLSGRESSPSVSCPDNQAFVVLEQIHAQELADAVSVLNSMPLSGRVTYRYGNGLADVTVSVPEEYAHRNHLGGFDVAKKLEGFAALGTYGIRQIVASTCYGGTPDYDTSNAGTIGHGR